MSKPADYIEKRRVGSVSKVNSSEFVVELDPEAPQGTALNTGQPKRFPRVNSYVIVPVESEAVAGLVTNIYVEQAAFPKREGYEDFGVVDLPFPARHLEVVPIGTIEYTEDKASFQRGVNILPTVGDTALIPRSEEARCLVRFDDGRISVGSAPHLDGSDILLDPNRMFGRHTAVMGNTGSGKSCTVTKIIRECVEAAADEDESGASRFVVLDPNGEYADALSDLPNSHVFTVDQNADHEPFRLPAWMFDGLEWSAFARAKPDAQRPVLFRALQILRSGNHSAGMSLADQFARDIGAFGLCLSELRSDAKNIISEWKIANQITTILEDIREQTLRFLDQYEPPQDEEDDSLLQVARNLKETTEEAYNESTYTSDSDDEVKTGNVKVSSVDDVLEALRKTFSEAPDFARSPRKGEDRPIRFPVKQLSTTVKKEARRKGNIKYVRPMCDRIESLFALERTEDLLAPDDDVKFGEWLQQFFGADSATSRISIIDLSLIPEDVLHLVTAVFARLVFETLQRFRKVEDELLPTTLVVDEAHHFMSWQPRTNSDEEYEPEAVCRDTFQKIAKEGRKFGLGLLVSSQRPAELDDTVLSQCNTVILHRLSNQRDFDKVSALVPAQLSDFLDFLPALPKRQALILGAAVSIPVLMEVDYLSGEYRPDSKDPEFWKCWTEGPDTRKTFKDLVEDWQDH